MKKLLTVFVTVILLMVCAVSVNAAETGTCGDNLTWTLDGDTLTISGTGPMYNYTEENPAPWSSSRGLRKVIIEEGVTTIGDYAFVGKDYGHVNVRAAASVTRVGQKAFTNLRCSVFFCGSAPTISEDAFLGGDGSFYYVDGWEASDRQSYGGRHNWYKATLELSLETKRVYAVDEQLKPKDFVFKALYNGGLYQLYTPQTLQCDPYDNSVCGEKRVKVVADGFEFLYTYFVSDGQQHIDLVTVEQPKPQYYCGREIEVEPTVTVGDFTLVKNTHYTVSYSDNLEVGANAQIKVTGIGEWEGLSETVFFRILKYDIADADIRIARTSFSGMPLMPKVEVFVRSTGVKLESGTDYIFYYQNNVNMGKGIVTVMGIGNCCGYVVKEFNITDQPNSNITLRGAYNGKLGETLNDQVYYQEAVVTPGVQTFHIDSAVGHYVRSHYAYYTLYRMEGETPVLITTKETEYGYGEKTKFVYDFSSVYEEAADKGGEIYMLSYAWVDSYEEIYSGVYVMIISAKVPDATSMVVEQVEGADDFRRAYVSAYGPDGNVGTVEWTTSDPSVATVNSNGVVFFKKPGSVTVTGKYGNLTDSVEVTAAARDLGQCDILHYEPQTGAASVCCDGSLLTAGTDYVLTVSEDEGTVTVTATGRGVFFGQIVREFATGSWQPLDHTHIFENCEDAVCGTCAYTRAATHTCSTQWSKNGTQHWHACTVCGEKADVEDHSLSSVDNTVCTVCGSLYTPGDLDNNGFVDNKDVEYLLWYTLFSEDYPLNQDADFDGNGQVDNKDVEYLLWHTLFSEDYPLVR